MIVPDPAGPRCFCRDCLADLDMAVRRCSACGSPRLVRHRALSTLTIAHIDCDAFYATVEKRDNPDIADKPVIIGGGKRGVVSAACYIARTYGVRSAMGRMRLRPALQRCQTLPPALTVRLFAHAAVSREQAHGVSPSAPARRCRARPEG